MSIRTGDKAAGFELPERAGETVDVGAMIGSERVVLLFFPLAFSPVCTDEMCHFRDNWDAWKDLGASIVGIGPDSPFVVDRFRKDEKIPFPVLSDFNRDIARQYDVVHEDLFGMRDVPKRSIFVIGADGVVTWEWITDDPSVQIPFDELKAALA